MSKGLTPSAGPPSGSPGTRRLGLARVHGRSMEPTLHEGDLLLVVHGATPRPDLLVVVLLPGGVVAVKRAVWHGPDGWWVERDNPREGVDSWSVGMVPDRDVLAVVVTRVWPARAPRGLHGSRNGGLRGGLRGVGAAVRRGLRHLRFRVRRGR